MAGWAAWLGRIGLGVAAALVLLAAGTVIYETAAGWRPEREERALVREGRAIYAEFCAACHGARLEGAVFDTGMAPPPLKKPGFAFWFYAMPRDMEGFVAGLIGTGRGLMPPMGLALTVAQRRSLAAFIHRANTGAPQL